MPQNVLLVFSLGLANKNRQQREADCHPFSPHAHLILRTVRRRSGDSTVPSYRIEVFTSSSTVSTSGSKFGQSEEQTITTQNVAEGTFTLAFGSLDHPLPGTVDVVNGEDFVVTSEDLTPYIKRGDRVAFDGGWDYEVHAFMPFNASHIYLAEVKWPGILTEFFCVVRRRVDVRRVF